jgi:hypothetical protein
MPDARLDIFATGGFTFFLSDKELRAFADDLDAMSAETGSATTLFLAEAFAAVCDLFGEHDERGGVRVDFIQELDKITRRSFPQALNDAKRMRSFRDEIIRNVAAYNP